MRQKMTISISTDLKHAMQLRDECIRTNWSKIAAAAFRDYLIANPEINSEIDDEMIRIISREQARVNKKRTDP